MSESFGGRKMFRILFFMLVLMSSFAAAQIVDTPPVEPRPEAYKLEEFGKATNGYVKMIFDSFMTELNNNPSAQGYIINYGTAKEIRVREKQIRNAIAFRKYDTARITIVNGGNSGKLNTQLWIVPAGAENPKP